MKARILWIALPMLVAAMALAGCAAQQEGTTTSTAPPSSATSTPAPAEAPTASTTAPPVPPVAQGQTATTGHWKVSIDEVEREDSAGGARAASGKQLLVVKVDVANNNTTGYGVGPTAFKLTDASGATLEAAQTSDSKFIFNMPQPVKAGETRNVLIAFEVPIGSGPFTLTFYPPTGGLTSGAALEVK